MAPPALRSALRIGGAASALGLAAWYANRRRRARWQELQPLFADGDGDGGGDGESPPPSFLGQYHSLTLAPGTTVGEANRRRTAEYYARAREAHGHGLVLGYLGPHFRLVRRRRAEERRLLARFRRGNQSHRTIVVMCDGTTGTLLADARDRILDPLGWTPDPAAGGGRCWIPGPLGIIPREDLHVTVAIPWWWHTMREGNRSLSEEMAARFRRTLLLQFHHPFQIELERIVLLGGRVLVALWRCVGERTAGGSGPGGTGGPGAVAVHDRHGDGPDPFVRLREEVVRCFTTGSLDRRRRPLTYQHRKGANELGEPLGGGPGTPRDGGGGGTGLPPAPTGGRGELRRQDTIEERTPGFAPAGADGGGADGFIHTTLARLPLECLSSRDVELGPVHRLCREASAALSGHRMVVDRYRFLETTGEGGDSNPCLNPIYDEIIEAPLRHTVDLDGTVREDRRGSGSIPVPPPPPPPPPVDGAGAPNIARSLTIGAPRHFQRAGSAHEGSAASLTALFRPPEDGMQAKGGPAR